MSRTKRRAPRWVSRNAPRRGDDRRGERTEEAFEKAVKEHEKLVREQATDKNYGSEVGSIRTDIEIPDYWNEVCGDHTHEAKTEYARYWRHKNKLKLKKEVFEREDDEQDGQT